MQKIVFRYQAECEAAFEPCAARITTRAASSMSTRVTGSSSAGKAHRVKADAGAETIAWHYQNEGSDARRWRRSGGRCHGGFVTPQPHKRPRSSWDRFEADLPKDVRQVDIRRCRTTPASHLPCARWRNSQRTAHVLLLDRDRDTR